MSVGKCAIGFQTFVRLNPLKPIELQLGRKRLVHRKRPEDNQRADLMHTIEVNASLKVNFGWSFESGLQLQKIMEECEREVFGHFNIATGTMITDMSCDWIGFVPHNIYDKEVYKDFSIHSLILHNNEIVDFQISVIEFIVNHHLFKKHAILRDDGYRFAYFKSIRRDTAALEDAFHYYMSAIEEISLVPHVPQDIVESDIGCHFLYNPDLFFELMLFSKLKGKICD